MITPTPPASTVESRSRVSSALSDAPAVSTVHVTVPTVLSDRDEFKTPSQTNKTKQEPTVSTSA